ncbi:MAG: hypothetical protein ACKORF_02750 [Micrococcales bacterium]
MANREDAFEAAVKKFENRLEAGVLKWVRNDQVFNGFRNTPARLILALGTTLVIYGFPIASVFTDSVSIWSYVLGLAICLIAQKLSVRFVFDDNDVIDEYQQTRRNKAYRKAYKRIGLILILAAALCLAGIYYQEKLMGSGWQWEIETYKANFGLVFIIGLFTLQKYLSWGLKGEPMN